MAAPNNMHNLTTLIKRLEAATSRLEDIATSVDPNGSNPLATSSQLSVPASIGTTQSVTPTVVPTTPAPPPEPLPRSVEDFDKILDEQVAQFVAASKKIGGLVEQQASSVQKAFQAERSFLLMTTKAKKPDEPPPELMTEIHRNTSAVDELREANRASPLFNHLSAVSDGIVVLFWIVNTRPADFVTDTLGSAQYYGNKILKEYKEKDKTHIEYIQAYYKVFRALTEYVKEHYARGLTWNQKDGIDAVEALKQIQSGETPTAKGAPAAGGAPPPPPPPPPPPLPTLEQLNGPAPPAPGAGAAKGGDMSAVFNQLNQGSSVTSGLRKVDRSEMTHKNPSLRAGSTVPQRSDSQTSTGSATRGKSPMPARKPDSLRTKKPPRKELDGTKWIIENFDNTGSDIIEIPAELNHSILISRCSKCIIKVKGKANAISIDNCNGLSILVESLVSSLDVIKSPKFAVQVDGVLPTVLLDQVDGGQIYLGEKSIKDPPEVLTSKCSAINVVLPPVGDEDSKEQPLPEQLRTYLKNGKLVTEIVEHAG